MNQQRLCIKGLYKLCGFLAAACILSQLAAPMKAFGDTGDKELSTVYGIGSTSKVVTAAAVLKLAGEGLIDLDAPLIRYIPDFRMNDSRYQSITPRMLLDHTSGLQGSSLANSMLLGDNDTYNHDHLLEALSTQRLKADPGAYGTYCNDGFTLAEILVERVTGLSFTEYLAKAFAAPLGLSTFMTPQDSFEQGLLASTYDARTGTKLPAERPNVIGSGGIYASAADLCRFSQIFMESPGQANGLLPEGAARAMAHSQYLEDVGGAEKDSILSYGLGWDSVNTYPFNRYGIKALSKGGDTSYYHSSLIVLPEENVSCAVLSSGGSSTFNQLAAQEILLAFLEETGRIEADAKTAKEPSFLEGSSQAVSVPEDLAGLSGWYSGKSIFKLDMTDDGLSITDSSSYSERTQTYAYQADGTFLSPRGQYIDVGGSMAASGNGQLGQTSLSFQTREDGSVWLMGHTYEYFPSLGQTAMYLPIAKKLPATPAPQPDVLSSWKERDGREYFLVSDKYTSTAYLTTAATRLKVMDEPAGYLAFMQSGFSPALLSDASRARFFLQLPGQIGRDLDDYEIRVKNGAEYLETGSFSLISETSVPSLPQTGFTVTIPADGETQWFTCGPEFFGSRVTVTYPDTGSFFLYERQTRETVCIQSSYTLDSGRAFVLPSNGLLAFAGTPGAQFQIQIKK